MPILNSNSIRNVFGFELNAVLWFTLFAKVLNGDSKNVVQCVLQESDLKKISSVSNNTTLYLFTHLLLWWHPIVHHRINRFGLILFRIEFKCRSKWLFFFSNQTSNSLREFQWPHFMTFNHMVFSKNREDKWTPSDLTMIRHNFAISNALYNNSAIVMD